MAIHMIENDNKTYALKTTTYYHKKCNTIAGSSFVCVNFINGTHYLQIFIVQNYFLHNYRDNDKGKRNEFRTAAINL
jgi:hypothetical protein